MSFEITSDMAQAAKQLRSDQKPDQLNKQTATSSQSNSLRYEAIKQISNHFSLDKTDIKQLFGISESTQFRYEKQNAVLKPAIADRLERFNRIYQQASELFEDESETQRWLSTPKAALEGNSPLKVLATDAGAKLVEEILYRAEYGIFG